MNLYVIRDWKTHYEKAQSRQVDRVSWVPLPVKHDGLGFRRLMRMKNGIALYGAWVLIVQVAAKCPLRGTLADEKGRPLTPEDISLMTGAPSDSLLAALQVFSSEDIGWIQCVSYELTDSELLASYNLQGGQESTGQNKTEEGAPADAGCPPELSEWLNLWNELHADGAVLCGVDAKNPSQAVRKGWGRVQKSSELRKLLADKAPIVEAIRESAFVRRGGWFRLEKLFGGKNRDGEFVARKLLEGGYREDDRTGSQTKNFDFDHAAIFGGDE